MPTLAHCYYCGTIATQPLQVSDTFTATDIRSPHSAVMCDRCHTLMFGDLKKVWVYNGTRQAWVTLYTRSLCQLWQGNRLIYPQVDEPQQKIMTSSTGRVGKPETWGVVNRLPTRVDIREWLVNPPEPPFTIAIPESGQKHILYRAQESCDRAYFPVQFEMDTLYLDHAYFLQLLTAFEALMAMEFSKTEINSGVYRHDRMRAAKGQYLKHDDVLICERSRGEPTRLLQLISFVAQKPEIPGTESETSCCTESPTVATTQQLTLVL